MAHTIGIDLGTTNSVVAFLENDRAEVIPNAEGQKITPSVVLYESKDEIIVGEMAKRQQVTKPNSTIRSVKRFMGRRFSEIEDQSDRVSYRVEVGENDDVDLIVDDDIHLKPEGVSAEILKKLRQTAEDYLGQEVTQAVITVPAYFNDSQRQATKKAGELAGLEVLRIINEPTAAALAYGLNKDKCERVAVFDFGGGTFDITILDLNDELFEVLSTNGDTALGGDDIDQAIYEHICREIIEQTGLDPTDDSAAVQRIRESAEQAKCELSSVNKTSIHLPFVVADESGPRHYAGEIERAQFEELIQPILERLGPPCRQALEDAGLTEEDIDTVLLVGGSTRIPAVQKLVEELFGKPPSKGVNPDESVAIGAAIQAGIISGSLEEVLLLDVTPLSLGIELAGGIFSVLIPRNNNVPTSVEKMFTTVVDNQKTVQIHVLQGERKVAEENRTLAHFKLEGIAPAPREVPEIRVKFHLDANGILSVSATDITSGASKDVTVVAPFTVNDDELETILHDAEEHGADDMEYLKIQRRVEQAKRNSEMIKDFLDQNGTVLDEADMKNLREAMFRLDISIEKQDLDAIANAEAELLGKAEKFADLYYSHRAAYDA